MTMKDLAKALGVSFEDDMDDATIGAAIKSFVTKLKSKPDNEDKQKIAASLTGIHGIEADAEDDAVISLIKNLVAPSKPKIAASASTVRMAGENRELRIQKLVDDCLLTPAVAKELKETFCDESQVKLVLSMEDNDGVKDGDKFDCVITALSKNEPIIEKGENTPTQLDPKDNPLIAAIDNGGDSPTMF